MLALGLGLGAPLLRYQGWPHLSHDWLPASSRVARQLHSQQVPTSVRPHLHREHYHHRLVTLLSWMIAMAAPASCL